MIYYSCERVPDDAFVFSFFHLGGGTALAVPPFTFTLTVWLRTLQKNFILVEHGRKQG